MNDNLDGTLSGEYSLPKIKGNFKGDHTPEFHILFSEFKSSKTIDSAEAETEAEIEEDNALFFGTPFAVLKVRDFSQSEGQGKVFVNVCVHDTSLKSHQVVIGEECPRTVKDKKGDSSTTYDVCVNSVMIDSAAQQEQVCKFYH